MVNRVVGLCLFFFIAAHGFSQKQTLSVFALNREALQINKAKLIAGDVSLKPAFNNLLKIADEQLGKNKMYTVMEKKQMPPSNDMHDYMSIAIYYWPDTTKPNGLPYISKDGQINPEVEDYKDKVNIGKMVKSVSNYALAYYFSNDEKYAQKAAQQIKAWFLDPSTKMNPNLNYAQAVKGRNDGRGIGIIESRLFIDVIDAVGLIQSSSSWSKSDQLSMEKWFADYLQWLMTSKNGLEEFKTKNNHGIWYDVQKLDYAIFSHHDEIAENTYQSLLSRMEDQMDETGFFPLELKRTIALHYSAFIMEPLFLAANMSLSINKNMWKYVPPSGKSLKKGFEVLMPYLSKEKDWFGNQIKPFDYKMYAPPLLAAGFQQYQCANCKTAIADILEAEAEKSILHLTTLID